MTKQVIMIRAVERCLDMQARYMRLFVLYVFVAACLGAFKIYIEDDNAWPEVDLFTSVIMGWLLLCIPYVLMMCVKHTMSVNRKLDLFKKTMAH